MKVLLYACEGQYQGYHGIEDYMIEEFPNNSSLENIYHDYIPEMSFELMQSFGTLDEYYAEYEDYEEEERNEIMEDIINENISGYVVKIRDDVKESVGELNQILNSLGVKLFIKEYSNGEYY